MFFPCTHMYNRLKKPSMTDHSCAVGRWKVTVVLQLARPTSEWQTKPAEEKLRADGASPSGHKNTSSLKINGINLIRAVTCSASPRTVSQLHFELDRRGAHASGVCGTPHRPQGCCTLKHAASQCNNTLLRHQLHLQATQTRCTEWHALFGPLKALYCL